MHYSLDLLISPRNKVESIEGMINEDSPQNVINKLEDELYILCMLLKW